SGRTAIVSVAREVVKGTRLGLLDDHVLAAARRFPRLVTGLQVRIGEQNERLAAQLVVCQMARVEDRVLAMMWLVAQSWGRGAGSGTVLPLNLTHDVLGELIGAKRSTVTLALSRLAEANCLIKQDQGWLLIDSLPTVVADESTGLPAFVEPGPSPWDDSFAVPP